jgi:hypothetical protein
MPTIRGLFTFFGAAGAWPWIAVATTLTLGAVVYKLPMDSAISLATAGSLLISPGSFQHDLAFLAVPVCAAPTRYVALRVISAVQVLLVVVLRPASAAFFNGILLVVFCAVLASTLSHSSIEAIQPRVLPR